VVPRAGSKDYEPSRDLFAFDGRLRGAALTGLVTRENRNATPSRSAPEKVTLRESREETELMQGAATYREWRERWQPILEHRGPKG